MKITDINELCKNFKVQDNIVAVSTAFEINLHHLEHVIADFKIFQEQAHKEHETEVEFYWAGAITGLNDAIRAINAIKNCIIIPKPKELENE